MMSKGQYSLAVAVLLTAPLLVAQAPVVDRDQEPQQRQAPSDQGARSQGDSGVVMELYNQLQQLQQEMMMLRGIVEEQDNELRRLKQQSMERYIELDRRIAELDGGGSQVDEDTAAAAATASDEELQAYRDAYQLLRERDFGQAAGAFETFIEDHPESRYTANAWYWLGELHLVDEPRDLEASRDAFQRVLDEHPDSDKVADALFKLGTVRFMQGEEDRARQHMNEVIENHGGSSAAQLAQQFLRDNF